MSYNFCPNCNNNYKSFKDCPECDIPLQTSHAGQHIDGNKNQAIQINGDNQGDIVLHQNMESTIPTTTVYRESIKPLSINGSPFKNWWLFFAGGLGLTANMVTTLSYFRQPITSTNSSSNIMLFVMVFSMLLLIAAIFLHQKKYLTVPFGRTLEKDKEGNIYITKIGGTCGLCNDPVRITTVGPKENRQTRVECTNNPDQHWCEFDRTILMDVGDEYRTR